MTRRSFPVAALTAILLTSPGAHVSTAALAGENPGDAGAMQPANPCVTVASAKFAQWSAERMMIRESETFADGTQKQVEAIFTPDSAYGHEVGRTWRSMNLALRQRGLAPPDVLAKRMGLTQCQLAGAAEESRQPASLYTYDYFSDSHASHVSGKVWISNASGLPLRQELQQEPSQPNVPVAISARFSYGDSVQIPEDATRADIIRRELNQRDWLGFTASTEGSGAAGAVAGATIHRR